MGYFKLDPVLPPEAGTPPSPWASGLTDNVLLHNARWFIQIRWIVVTFLGVLGVAGILMDQQFLMRLGFFPQGIWPLGMAGILALLNLGSIWWVRNLSPRATWRGVTANIWFQIVSDLVFLTILIYLVGTTNTVISFTYLFHITLACIFFGRRDSFIVTLLSASLFLSTVTAQCIGLIPYATVFASSFKGSSDVFSTVVFCVPAVFVSLIVWYLVSSLSETVRQQYHDLDHANKRLIRADEEINLQMLRVTHDLKAPFSGIESNIEIIKQLHWADVPVAVQEIIGKIDARSSALRARIGDILMLGNLRSDKAEKQIADSVDLHELLGAVIQDVRGLAVQKTVTVTLSSGECRVLSDNEKLTILFSNLVSNAIVYSRDGSTVDVRIDKEAAGVRVSIEDHGIGISEQALPHVFDDFYRTQEAAAFNQASTGLGLSIVRQIADKLRLTIEVKSEKDKGSVFQIIFPGA
ncbi:MAG: HAMP domain-containing sensor histidine kinase [bacterium]